MKTLITQGPTAVWPTTSPGALTTGMGTVLGATLTLLVAPVVLIRRRGRRPSGLAGRRELSGLLPKGATTRARQLRPSLPKSGKLPRTTRATSSATWNPAAPNSAAATRTWSWT